MTVYHEFRIAAQANSAQADVKRSGRSHNPAILDQLKQSVR